MIISSAIYANRLYLELYNKYHPNRLSSNKKGFPIIIGNVFIHPSANVDGSAVVCCNFIKYLTKFINF